MSNETKSGTPKLNEALKKAQEEMVHPKRTKTNPHFGSKYADLDDCWEAWMKVGPKNGLTVSQGGGVGAPPNHLRLVTTLAHVSGEERTSTLDIPFVKHDPQAFMAAFTYVRRAGLCGITGMVADTDDDGNSAARPAPPAASRPAARPTQAAKPAQRTSSGVVFPNYGTSKGLPVSGASKKDLDYYRNGALRTLNDPSKAKFHEKERILLDAIERELAMGAPQQGDNEPPPPTDDDAPF